MPDDDAHLLLRTHAGDERAARELWERHAGALLAYARSILRSPHDADDAVQSVFCALLALRRSDLRRITDARAFLARSTRNAALNALRSRRRDAARARARAHPRPRPHTDPIEPSRDHDLAHALESIPRRLREIVMLRHAAGLNFDQIAAATGLPRSTAASRYQAALAALRVHLTDARPLSVPAQEATP